MWLLSLCGTKHMMMRHRNEWLAWAATAVGSLGLLGLASAQTVPQGEWSEALAAEMSTERLTSFQDTRIPDEEVGPVAPISDDGWSTELPVARQLVITRQVTQSPLSIDVFNERGEVVGHIDWADGAGRVKPVALDALLAGRYAVRITGIQHSKVVRFRKD